MTMLDASYSISPSNVGTYRIRWFHFVLFVYFLSFFFPRISIFSLGDERPVELRLEEFIAPIVLFWLFKRLQVKSFYIPIPWLMLILLAIFAALRSLNPYTFLACIRQFEFLLAYLLARNVTIYKEDRRKLLSLTLSLSFVVASWFFYQRITGDVNGIRIGSALFGTARFEAWSGAWSGKLSWGRGTLPFDLEPANISGFSLTAGSILASAILSPRLWYCRTKILPLIALLCILCSVAISISRGALIAFFAQLTILLLIKVHPKSAYIKFFTLVGLLSIILLAPVLYELLLNKTPELLHALGLSQVTYASGDSGRMELWIECLARYLNSDFGTIIFGTGYVPAGWADNAYLRILLDYGALGLLILIFFIYKLITASLSIYRQNNDASLLLLLAGFMIGCVANDLIYASKVMIPLGIAAGLLINLNHSHGPIPKTTTQIADEK